MGHIDNILDSDDIGLKIEPVRFQKSHVSTHVSQPGTYLSVRTKGFRLMIINLSVLNGAVSLPCFFSFF